MKRRKKTLTRHSELIKAALIVFLIGLVLRIFVIFPHHIKIPDMENVLYQGDFLLASQLAYKFTDIKTGDIVVFEHPFKMDELKVGRIVAEGGQTIEILDKSIYIDDEPFADFENIKHVDLNIIPEDYSNRDYVSPVNVPDGAVYILCDNRDVAEDSRDFGVVSIENIKGKGLFVYWSWRPDPNSPEWESPYIFPAIKILFYNLFHFPSRVGWSRIGSSTD
ncbi:MAG: signal peptidase I [candidate division Zixibacteria bacterium]|nr:signal peptidase I [candidate division Zixibacteria bacterium]